MRFGAECRHCSLLSGKLLCRTDLYLMYFSCYLEVERPRNDWLTPLTPSNSWRIFGAYFPRFENTRLHRQKLRPNATSSKSILDTCDECVTEDGKQRLGTQQHLFLLYNQSLAFPTFTSNLMKQSISNIGAHTYINGMYATDHI